MRVPFKLSAVLIACTFALTACGSSSSGESAKIEKNSFGVKVSTSPQKATFDKITVDGKEIDLAKAVQKASLGNPNQIHPVFASDSSKTSSDYVIRYNLDVADATFIASVDSNYVGTTSNNAHNFEYVIAGATNDTLFIQGEKTATSDIPTSGTVSYKGGTLRFVTNSEDYVDSNGTAYAYPTKDNLLTSVGVIAGRIESEVDFDNKTITGFLRDAGRGGSNETFEGTLSGNGFAANWTDGDSGKGLEGNFYGPAATEMAGEFERSNSFGVFIAEQTATE
ncbi:MULTISPECIES: transferrin-binding protein-like solute binding protein [unclassified Lonepinella]|uniref:transferrin-binding protein-like solute binding protein n=1 Tax=unclassified Lonepinella TaxID=2642006 RepID=UPI0036DBA16C